MANNITRKDDPCGPGKLLAPIRSTRLRTSVPGPLAQAAIERSKMVMNTRTANSQLPLVVQKTHGALVYDVDGNVFIDFACAMLPTGHTPDSTLTALRNGAETLLYFDETVGVSNLELQVCERLNALMPFGPCKTVLFDSPVEIATNIARSITVLDWDSFDFLREEVSEVIQHYKKEGYPLIVDEIMTGLGRTGKLFAFQYSEMEPDAIVIERSAAAGLPFAALIGKAEFIDTLTYNAPTASALSCTAALETINAIVRDDLPSRALQIEALIRERVDEWRAIYDWLGELHGIGLALALDVGTSERAHTIRNTAFQNGLILEAAAIRYPTRVRLLPPLMIPEEQLHEGLDILEAAFGAV